MPEDQPKHPNAATDPDCTNVQALEEALQIRIAAEVYGELITYLKRHHPNAMIQASLLLRDIELIYEQVSTKNAPLRKMIGLTK
jgi:hypothetical protein